MIKLKEQIFNEIMIIEEPEGISIVIKSKESAAEEIGHTEEIVLYKELELSKALEKYALISQLIEQDKIIEVRKESAPL